MTNKQVTRYACVSLIDTQKSSEESGLSTWEITMTKRAALHSVAGCIAGDEPIDAKQMRHQYLEERFAEYLR